MPINEPDIIPIANHLIGSGLHHEIGLGKHYYPLAATDTTGKLKSIPPDCELRDLNKELFIEHYKGKYAAHYLDSAVSFAIQHIQSWRTLGGDITSTPHIRKPIARLNNDLYTIQESKPDGTMRIRITIVPHQIKEIDLSDVMTIQKNHKKKRESVQVEDLHGTTQDILIDDRGTKSKLYYTRGTSRYYPFCSSKLTHPTLKKSKCPNCGLFDRDKLDRDIFSQSIESKLLHSSKLMIQGLPSRHSVMYENRSEEDNRQIMGSEMIESGYDANSVIDELKVRLSM